jgi:hypothetical protein
LWQVRDTHFARKAMANAVFWGGNFCCMIPRMELPSYDMSSGGSVGMLYVPEQEDKTRLRRDVSNRHLRTNTLPTWEVWELENQSLSLINTDNLAPLCSVQGRTVAGSRCSLLLFPFLRGLALCAPSVYLRNLVLQRRIHQAVPLEAVLASKLGRHNERRERLATATCTASQLVVGKRWMDKRRWSMRAAWLEEMT